MATFNLLAVLSLPNLCTKPIAHFHDGQVRYRNLQEAIADDSCQRLHQVQEEVSFIEAHRDILQRPLQLQTEGQLPLRVTHNDTKLNNVLIDEQTGAGLCVIDLDTVMPGLVLYDFGDMVRTMICDAPEDEPDSTQIHIDLDRFEAIARGFSQGIDNLLTTEEVDSLVLGGPLHAPDYGNAFSHRLSARGTSTTKPTTSTTTWTAVAYSWP